MEDQFQHKQVSRNGVNPLQDGFTQLIEAIAQAVIKVGETQQLETALAIRDEIRRLPDELVTEVLNQVMLKLILTDPLLCRWFVLDVFLYDADPSAKADVAERMNLLLADLRSA
ncbi:hypothetical protein AB3R30_24140 [Leptolyngbyaceae cyanobacterium UHCC 1019]